jgi:hypothetical protein
MLLRPGTLAGAALLRAMVPLSDPPHPDFSGERRSETAHETAATVKPEQTTSRR